MMQWVFSQRRGAQEVFGLAETSRSALSVDRKGRLKNEIRKRMANLDLNQGEVFPNREVPGVGDAVRRGIFRGTTSRRKMEKAKSKKKISYMSQSDRFDAFILFLASKLCER